MAAALAQGGTTGEKNNGTATVQCGGYLGQRGFLRPWDDAADVPD